MSCIVAVTADKDPNFAGLLNAGEPASKIARKSNVSATAIKDHRREVCICHKISDDVAEEIPAGIDFKRARVEVSTGGASGEFSDVVTTEKVAPVSYDNAFAKVFELAGLDPSEYRIIGDTVGFSSWQQSARTADGDRDVVTLFAYKAKFQRISDVDKQTEERLKALAEHVRERTTFRKYAERYLERCHTTLWADWQLGKDSKTDEIVERVLTDLEAASAEWESDGPFEELAVCFMGDPIENVSDSYVNQAFVTDLNLTDQLMLALELMTKIITEALRFSNKVHAAFVLCNHGQLSRKGTKTNVTDDADNAQNLLARLLRDHVFKGEKRIEWHIPESGEMITRAYFSHVPVALAHGHKITGREDNWLLKQTATLTAKYDFTPRIWLTAHKHQFNVLDLGSVHRIQSASIVLGSKYFEDTNGVYSVPGTVRLIIGDHDRHGRGFTDADLI